MTTTHAPGPSLAERAYLAIRDMIVALELPPGAVVDERGLMERLSIGRTPTREALKRLGQENLVEVFPRRGMFVTRIEIRDLAEISELRVVLEGEAARLAALRASASERASLASLADELAETTVLEPSGLMALDERVHRSIAHAAGNRYLEEEIARHYVLALRIWYLALDRASELGTAVGEHRHVLEAILDGDAPRATTLMHEHVRGFENAIRAVLA